LQVGTTSGTTTSFNDIGLTPTTSYSYQVRASDAAPNLGPYSGIASATTQAAGATDVVVVSSRTTGMVPLAVHFDATGTTSQQTTRPFHEIYYKWEFNDPDGGSTWSYGAKAGTGSKNVAYGATAGHIFKTAGTYIVTLTVFDGVATSTAAVTITAYAQNDATNGCAQRHYYSTSNTFTAAPAHNPPAVTHHHTSTFALTDLATSRCLYFRGGEIFTAASSQITSVAGPWAISSFDTGNAIVRSAFTGGPLVQLNNGASDGRFHNFEFDGQGNSTRTFVAGSDSGTITRITFVDLNIHNGFNGIYNDPAATNTEWFVHDSQVVNMLGASNNIRVNFVKGSIQGNNVDGSAAGKSEHLLRAPISSKVVYAHNRFANAPATKETITIRGNDPSVTNFNIISDNEFICNTYACIDFDAAFTGNGAQIDDNIVERNWFRSAGTGGFPDKYIDLSHSERMTIRNNLFEGTADNGGIFVAVVFSVESGWVESNTDLIWIYNNTAYTNQASGDTARFVNLSGSAPSSSRTNTTIRNNIIYAPPANITTYDVWAGTGLNIVASNNSEETVGVSNREFVDNPGPSWASPSAPANFQITTGSYAIGQGFAVPVWDDFFGNIRYGQTNSMGFHQFPAGALP